jgi:hypothetical protein
VEGAASDCAIRTGWRGVDRVYFLSGFLAGASDPSFSRFILPFVGLMPIVSIAPLSFAALVTPGLSIPDCGPALSSLSNALHAYVLRDAGALSGDGPEA